MDISKGLKEIRITLLDENEKGLVGISRRTTKLRLYRFDNNYGLHVKLDKKAKGYKIKIIKYLSKLNAPIKILKAEDIELLNILGFNRCCSYQTLLSLIEQVSCLKFSNYKEQERKD